ncbi:hypothetical protein PoB_007121500 [Plakobranchus ocellatus]|uniref:Uncharacterized protein n=1 Tax=Plakobranchus ocellatus TaxID=259542 RepID=A0AAV4DKP3_9GAST|nr:hypothetical protein PoB_007121500 [Plakobranchus ocellatus]
MGPTVSSSPGVNRYEKRKLAPLCESNLTKIWMSHLLHLDTLPELIARSISQATLQQRQDMMLGQEPPRLPVARPLSEFTGLRRTTNPRQRRPFQQQFSLREMPIYDRGASGGRDDDDDEDAVAVKGIRMGPHRDSIA